MVLEAVNLVHNAIGNVLGDSLGHLAAVPPLQEVVDAPACMPTSRFRAGSEDALQPEVVHQSRMVNCTMLRMMVRFLCIQQGTADTSWED